MTKLEYPLLWSFDFDLNMWLLSIPLSILTTLGTVTDSHPESTKSIHPIMTTFEYTALHFVMTTFDTRPIFILSRPLEHETEYMTDSYQDYITLSFEYELEYVLTATNLMTTLMRLVWPFEFETMSILPPWWLLELNMLIPSYLLLHLNTRLHLITNLKMTRPLNTQLTSILSRETLICDWCTLLSWLFDRDFYLNMTWICVTDFKSWPLEDATNIRTLMHQNKNDLNTWLILILQWPHLKMKLAWPLEYATNFYPTMMTTLAYADFHLID